MSALFSQTQIPKWCIRHCWGVWGGRVRADATPEDTRLTLEDESGCVGSRRGIRGVGGEGHKQRPGGERWWPGVFGGGADPGGSRWPSVNAHNPSVPLSSELSTVNLGCLKPGQGGRPGTPASDPGCAIATPRFTHSTGVTVFTLLTSEAMSRLKTGLGQHLGFEKRALVNNGPRKKACAYDLVWNRVFSDIIKVK